MDKISIENILEKIDEYYFQKMDLKDDLKNMRNTNSIVYKNMMDLLIRIEKQLGILGRKVLRIRKELQLRNLDILDEIEIVRAEEFKYDEKMDETDLSFLENEYTENLSLIQLIDSYDIEELIEIQCFDNICALCRTELNQTMAHLPCDHCFHSKCMNELLKHQIFICPICKRDFNPADIGFSEKFKFKNTTQV